jgi:hypothetical protein
MANTWGFMGVFGRRKKRDAVEQGRREAEHAALEELVGRFEARLLAREAALEARERDLKAALAELRDAQAESAGAEADLARRERALEARVAMVTRREVDLARRAAELGGREREAAKPKPPPEATPAPERAPEAPPAPAAVPSAPGERYNLLALERLVEARSAEFPDKAEEWSRYLFFLREHAAADGSVPASFDGLIGDTFAELVLDG